MSSPLTTAPDVLVLGGGGLLGEAWLNAVLSALDGPDGFDVCACDGFVGTSAGSIVATALATGIRPRERLGDLADVSAERSETGRDATDETTAIRRALEAASELGAAAVAPLASIALSSTAGGGAALRRAALARVRPGRRSLSELGAMVERAGAQWDGRLRIATVEIESGRRVVMGAPGSPGLSVAEAVKASCAIPGVFEPVRFGGRTYLDGGAWSPTNMDAANVGRGGRVLCLNPTASLRPTLNAPVGALGFLSASRAALEALTLERRGASVRTINPDVASARAMGTNLMDPAPRAEVIAAGLRQGRRLARARAA
jgi:NTE family protein